MAKSKNHTNHNQSYKNHRNGIKRIMKHKYINSKGLNQKLKRNTRRARKFDTTIVKSKNLQRKVEVLRNNKSEYLKKLQELKLKPKKKEVKKEQPKSKGKGKK